MLHASYAIGMLPHTMSRQHENTLSSAIRNARGEMSQQAFATLIGTNILTLREWEKGRKVPFALLHVEALAARGVSMDAMRAAAAMRKAGVAA